MADTLYFSRNTKVYAAIGNNVWEIPVLDGFSFSQATNASEITLNEMSDASGNSRRGRQMFTDSYAPAEWSFSTYVRPFKSAGSGTGAADSAEKVHAVEEVLWAQMVGAGTYGSNTFPGLDHTADTNAALDISFTGANKTSLGTIDLFFVMGATSGGTETVYHIEGCCVNEASLDFDIDGIATINWSGMGKIIKEAADADHSFLSGGAITPTVTEGISSTSNFIRNRLTSLAISSTSPTNTTYDLVLTGGNITISNNMTFLTPETLGTVNQPLAHVTGTRSVTGNFTCYLNAEANSSADLFENIIEGTSTITNNFNLSFKVGGASGDPRLELDMAQCHLEVPSHGIEDVISLETNFHALPSTIDGTDELTIKYVAT
jgi:hypothetical protein